MIFAVLLWFLSYTVLLLSKGPDETRPFSLLADEILERMFVFLEWAISHCD